MVKNVSCLTENSHLEHKKPVEIGKISDFLQKNVDYKENSTRILEPLFGHFFEKKTLVKRDFIKMAFDCIETLICLMTRFWSKNLTK